jgi:predicted ribosome-associated RNA-binding protein Tma20
MSQKFRRYALKSKESKQILTQASEKLKINLESMFGSKANLDVVEADFGDLLLIDGKPVLFKQLSIWAQFVLSATGLTLWRQESGATKATLPKGM